MTVTRGNSPIPWRLRYSARAKRVRIIVRPGDVEVVAPPGTPVRGRHGIEAFVHSKSEWIAHSLRKVEARAAAARTVEQQYVDGARIPFRGDEALLELRLSDIDAIAIEIGDRIESEDRIRTQSRGEGETRIRNEAAYRILAVVPRSFPDEERPVAVRAAVHERLSRLALDDARRWSVHYGELLGRHPTDVRIGNQKTIWGSCAADGIIRINRRLIEAPPAAMEYVVAHEVAHLAERNHSPRFWAKLGEIQPDWRERKALLKEWERRRAMEGWSVG